MRKVTANSNPTALRYSSVQQSLTACAECCSLGCGALSASAQAKREAESCLHGDN